MALWKRLDLGQCWTMMARVLAIIALTSSIACARAAREERLATIRDTSRMVGSYEISHGTDSVSQVRLVEVTYGPGGSSPAHSHPCPVIGYVVEGEFRSRVDDEPERIYAAGETFYERANATHAVSANASPRSSTTLLAIFVCSKR
jgi:quercetin dioxygenase-like cupin family protein